jgi:hypothetical protein
MTTSEELNFQTQLKDTHQLLSMIYREVSNFYIQILFIEIEAKNKSRTGIAGVGVT